MQLTIRLCTLTLYQGRGYRSAGVSTPVSLHDYKGNMATSLTWTCRAILRSFRALEERIAYNLGLINAGINPEAAVLGNITSPQTNGCLEPQEDGLLLMAVPKKRTSASKRKLRNRHKWLKNRSDIETCVVCGNFKIANHLCGHCVAKVRTKTIEFRKERDEGAYQWPIPEILRKFRT